MKLNRTRELWRATSPSGRWYYEIERQASQDLESLFQENFELRDAVESYKIAEASLRNQIKELDQAWLDAEGKIAELEAKAEHAEVKGWQNAVSCIQTAVSNWHQDVRDYEGRQALLQAEKELVDELISESPGNWLEEEWTSQQEWMQKVTDLQDTINRLLRLQEENSQVFDEHKRKAQESWQMKSDECEALRRELEQYKKARGPVISRELYEKMMNDPAPPTQALIDLMNKGDQ